LAELTQSYFRPKTWPKKTLAEKNFGRKKLWPKKTLAETNFGRISLAEKNFAELSHTLYTPRQSLGKYLPRLFWALLV